MTCPICDKRKAKRYCPAKAASICPVCCGTEREVTLDCPSDCPYLVESRRHDRERRKFDWSKLPFAEVKVPPSFARTHTPLLDALVRSISAAAQRHRALVDSDAIAATQALAETYRTLVNGIYYEQPPSAPLPSMLFGEMKAALAELRKAEAQQAGFPVSNDAAIRDALIFLTQLGATEENSRPKSRAFLDLLRRQANLSERSAGTSDIILVP